MISLSNLVVFQIAMNASALRSSWIWAPEVQDHQLALVLLALLALLLLTKASTWTSPACTFRWQRDAPQVERNQSNALRRKNSKAFHGTFLMIDAEVESTDREVTSQGASRRSDISTFGAVELLVWTLIPLRQWSS
jgi:hypothetical protein